MVEAVTHIEEHVKAIRAQAQHYRFNHMAYVYAAAETHRNWSSQMNIFVYSWEGVTSFLYKRVT